MFINALKLLMKFKTASLTEDVSSTPMFAVGESTFPQILSGGGYSMNATQYLRGEGPAYGGYQTGISGAFTLGFWLYPINQGMATHPDTGNAVTIEMPLLDFNEVGTGDLSIITLTENTQSSGDNHLTLSLNQGIYSASTEDYTTSAWHHFWIVYNGTSLFIYVDGKQHTLQGEYGAVPSSIDGSKLDVYINHNFNGYDYNVSKNYGYISDIFLINYANINEADMQRVINDGVDYFIDDNYTNTYVDKLSIYFNDPDTIIVTSSIDDMSYVYIGRNDGKILRGSPLMWETRRTFANDGEQELLGLPDDKKGQDSVDTWDIRNGFLELKDTNVRL